MSIFKKPKNTISFVASFNHQKLVFYIGKEVDVTGDERLAESKHDCLIHMGYDVADKNEPRPKLTQNDMLFVYANVIWDSFEEKKPKAKKPEIRFDN